MPPSQESLRRAISAQLCPFCGAGPFKSLGSHTSKAHAVSAAMLREMADLDRICSDEYSTDSRERLERRTDRAEMIQRGVAGSIEVGALQRAYEASMEARLAVIAERAPVMISRALAGDRVRDIAADLGVTPDTVTRTLKRHGVKPTLTQTNAMRRARLAKSRPAMEEAVARRKAALLAARVARFSDLGGDWEALTKLASEEGVTDKQIRGYFRRNGVPLPDGRAVTPLRGRAGGRQYVAKPKSPCSASGCDRDATRRGMCSMHYQRWRKDNA